MKRKLLLSFSKSSARRWPEIFDETQRSRHPVLVFTVCVDASSSDDASGRVFECHPIRAYEQQHGLSCSQYQPVCLCAAQEYVRKSERHARCSADEARCKGLPLDDGSRAGELLDSDEGCLLSPG